VDELKFGPDWSIPVIEPTPGVSRGVGVVDAFRRVEAETIGMWTLVRGRGGLRRRWLLLRLEG